MKKSKIIVTFDPNGLPQVKAKNITRQQLFDTGVFLNGVSRSHSLPKRKPNKFVKFFKCLYSATKPIKADKREILIPFGK